MNVTSADGGQGTISVDNNNQGVTFQGTDAQGNKSSLQIGESGSLPEEFPKEIPFPDNVVITASMAAENNGQKSYTITSDAEKSVEETAKLYQDYFKAKGYANMAETTMAEFAMLSGEKDGFSISVTITADPDQKGKVSGMIVYGAVNQ